MVTHEDSDPRRVEKLALRIKEEGILKNPPIVADLHDCEGYVVMDGANRVTAFAYLGIPHIVAQLVSYEDPGVMIDTWHHVVSGMDLDEFENALEQIDGLHLEPGSLEDARQELAAGVISAYIVCESGVRRALLPKDHQPSKAEMLNAIVDAYRGQADIFRASNDIWDIQKPYYPEITALVIFPHYDSADIIQAACHGYKIPSGITRHVIPARALNINVPLDVLWADWSLERKEAWLHNWLMERMAANAIRFYAEPTFSFNE
jgi:hypothetical protein